MSLSWNNYDLQNWINSGCKKNIASNVISLNCSLSHLTILPSEIKYFINLQKLECYCNRLNFLPDEICKLTKLRLLNCSANKLNKLPKNIGKLSNLVIFDCCHNQIKFLPNSMTLLSSLEMFFCNNNQLTKLPNKFELYRLEEFDCNRNNITNLMPAFSFLHRLKKINCSNNNLFSLPEGIYSTHLDLELFDCSYNEIKYIPSDYGYYNNYEPTQLDNEYYDEPSYFEIIFHHNNNMYIPPLVKKMICNKQTFDNELLYRCDTNSGIIKYMCKMTNIMPTCDFSSIIDFEINNDAKRHLMHYINDTTCHPIFGITFSEAFIHTLQHIINNNNKNKIDECTRFLNEHLPSDLCCHLTGRMLCLLSVMYIIDKAEYDLNIDTIININSLLIRMSEKYQNDDEYIVNAYNELLNNGQTLEMTNIWLSAI